MMQKKYSGGINIGTSSILVTFVLLAIVTFAALSYMSAKSDYTLSKEAADRMASYYDANRMAELYLANIEGLLAKSLYASDAEGEYYDSIEKIFADNDRITVSRTEEGKVILSYAVAVTQGQNLEVELVARFPDKGDDRLFYISKWSTEINEEWLEEIKKGDGKSGVKLLF